MTTRTNRTIDSIVGLAEGLTTKLVNARTVLLEQRCDLDGLIGRAYDNDKITGGKAELTTVERLTEQRQHIERQLASLDDELDAAYKTLRNLHHDCDRICATRLDTTPPECRNGQVGKDGTIEWGAADCERPADKSGLCYAHYMAWYRWRKGKGINTDRMFEEGVA